MRKIDKKFYGFTLIEVVIVLAIATLVMVVVFLGVTGAQRAARDNDRRAYAREILAKLSSYAGNNGGSLDGITAASIKSYVGDERKVIGMDVQTDVFVEHTAVIALNTPPDIDHPVVAFVNGEECTATGVDTAVFFVIAGTGITDESVATCLESKTWYVLHR